MHIQPSDRMWLDRMPKPKAQVWIRQLGFWSQMSQSWVQPYSTTGGWLRELGSSQTYSPLHVPWTPPSWLLDTDIRYCLVRGTETASDCGWTFQTYISLYSVGQMIPAHFRNVMWVRMGNAGRRGRDLTKCGYAFPFGGNAHLEWTHRIPAMSALSSPGEPFSRRETSLTVASEGLREWTQAWSSDYHWAFQRTLLFLASWPSTSFHPPFPLQERNRAWWHRCGRLLWPS